MFISQLSNRFTGITSRRAAPAPMSIAILLAALGIAPTASAAFSTFNGGLTEEAAWQATAGNTLIEDFESYSVNTQFQSLPALGITFDQLAGGGNPQVFIFGGPAGTPYGSKHLGNFPNGTNAINQWDDIVLRPAPGVSITAVGFWNGDGQNATLTAYAYSSSGVFLGSVGAFKHNFAGFVADTQIGWVRFDGNTGDGWNHLDGLQVNSVPEPSSLVLILIGVLTVNIATRCQLSRKYMSNQIDA